MADPQVNFFKSTLVGTYSDSDTSLTIATGDGALLPDPSVDGAFNLTIFEGLQVTNSTAFEIVRVTARSGDVLTVTRGQESTTPLTIGSATHSILMSATKKTFDDINDAIANVDLTTLTGVEELTFDSTGDEEFGLPAGTTAQRPSNPSAGYMRWNSTDSRIEFYNGSRWAGLSEIGLEQVSLGVAQLSVTANDALFEEVNQQNVQGTVSGYVAGGNDGSAQNVIDKFSLSSDANATDVGDLADGGSQGSGASSQTHGYVAGGRNRTGIEKYSFSSDSNGTSVGSLVIETQDSQGGTYSADFGYISGGFSGSNRNEIEKYSFSTDGNSVDVGDLTVARAFNSGQSSSTHGYVSGGSVTNVIDKHSFSTDGNSTDVGDLTVARQGIGESQSTTHGYAHGGFNGSSKFNIIEKFSFSSDGNSSDVGDLTVAPNSPSGQSSTTHGYSSGGDVAGGALINNINKYSHSSDGNATDIADLTVARIAGMGAQV